jgi:hypothetical protein
MYGLKQLIKNNILIFQSPINLRSLCRREKMMSFVVFAKNMNLR